VDLEGKMSGFVSKFYES